MRFNITLPGDLAKKIKDQPNRSALIAESLREKLVRDNKAQLDKELAEGYKVRAAEDKALSDDFNYTLQDGL